MKTNFKNFLYEGLIKLPSSVHQNLEKELESVIISYSRQKILETNKSLKKTKLVFDMALKRFDDFIEHNFPNFSINEIDLDSNIVSKEFSNATLKDMPQEYKSIFKKKRPKVEWNMKDNKIKLNFDFTGNSLKDEDSKEDEEAAAGQYGAVDNAIDVNLSKFKQFQWSYFLETFDRMSKEKNEDKIDELQNKISEILGRLKDLIVEYKGTLEHELVHYIQFNVLHKASLHQISDSGKTKFKPESSEGKDEIYYTSQVEFDPQIRSAVAKTISWYEKLKRNNYLANWKTLAKLVIGEIDLDKFKMLMDIDDETEFYANNMFSLKFFDVLKRNDIKQYKKAVKYYMIELEKRIKND